MSISLLTLVLYQRITIWCNGEMKKLLTIKISFFINTCIFERKCQGDDLNWAVGDSLQASSHFLLTQMSTPVDWSGEGLTQNIFSELLKLKRSSNTPGKLVSATTIMKFPCQWWVCDSLSTPLSLPIMIPPILGRSRKHANSGLNWNIRHALKKSSRVI